MKKTAVLFAAVSALISLGGCNKDSAGTGELKTSLDVSLVSNLWRAGDKISVNGVVSSPVEDMYDGKSKASFKFSRGLEAPYCAIFPVSAISEYKRGTATIVLPQEQAYIKGSYDPASFILSSSSSTTPLALSPRMSIVHLNITGTTSLSKITLSGNGEDALSGTFTSDFSSLTPKATDNSVSIVPKNPVDLPAEFFICIPPGTYSSFTITAFDSMDGVMTKNIEVPSTLQEGQMFSIPEFEYSTAPDPEPPIDDPVVADTILRVATYNILVTDGRRSEMSMSRSSATLGKVMESCKADIISINEIDDYFASNLPTIAQNAGMTGYTWKITNPNQVTSSGNEYYYANGLAYKTSKFELISSGMSWYTSSGGLTTNSATASSSHVPKYCTLVWVRLKHIPTSKQFFFISTHFPLATDGSSSGYKTGQANLACAKALNSFAGSLPDPCIFGADLNASAQPDDDCASGYSLLCQKWKNVYDVLAGEGKLDSFYLTYSGTLSGSSSKYYYDALTFTKDHPERRIDHIMFCNSGSLSFVPKSYSTIMTSYYCWGKQFCPSDHLPVVASFAIR